MVNTSFRGKFAIQNGTSNELDTLVFDETGTIVYEVLRIIDGVPLFVEDHFDRLSNSCQKMGLNFTNKLQQLTNELDNLMVVNNIDVGNVMIKISMQGEVLNQLMYFLPHYYPSENEYLNGVDVGLLHAERANPDAKVVNPDVRKRANQLLADTGVYEVLLVNASGFITEGSRSNVFFISENELFAAPEGTVLMGITMLKVLDICKENRIVVNRKLLLLNEIREFDAVFLTGTSPKVLPVSSVGKVGFNVNHVLLRQIMEIYDSMISDYVSYKKAPQA